MKWCNVSIALAVVCSFCIAGCGESTSATSEVERIASRDGPSIRHLSQHEHAWERAYARWDKAYRTSQATRFRAAERREIPIMSREADATYRAASSIDDAGLRAHYTTLAKWLLRQTSAIALVRDYVALKDTRGYARSVRKLDRIRSEGPALVERFQNYYQRRFGSNPFSRLETASPRG